MIQRHWLDEWKGIDVLGARCQAGMEGACTDGGILGRSCRGAGAQEILPYLKDSTLAGVKLRRLIFGSGGTTRQPD